MYIGLYINVRRSRDCAIVRASVWSSDSFRSLWATFTLTDNINALYNESVQRQEQHTSGKGRAGHRAGGKET